MEIGIEVQLFCPNTRVRQHNTGLYVPARKSSNEHLDFPIIPPRKKMASSHYQGVNNG